MANWARTESSYLRHITNNGASDTITIPAAIRRHPDFANERTIFIVHTKPGVLELRTTAAHLAIQNGAHPQNGQD